MKKTHQNITGRSPRLAGTTSPASVPCPFILAKTYHSIGHRYNVFLEGSTTPYGENNEGGLMGKNDLNHVTLVGRLTAAPTKDTLPSGTEKATFSIANNYYNPNNENAVSFFELVAFGKLAEIANTYLTKGAQIGICGELRQHRWKAKDGTNHNRVEIVVTSLQMLGSKNTNAGENTHADSPREKTASPSPTPQVDAQDVGEDEIPF